MYTFFWIITYIFMVSLEAAKSSDSDNSTNCIAKYSTIRDAVQLDCDDTSERGNFWKYNEQNVYINRNIISYAFEHALLQLRNDYSLVIPNVSIDHEGMWQCIRNSTEVARYCLYVQVPPKLNISIIGYNSNTVHFEYNKEVLVKCQAIGSRPLTTLVWRVNGRLVNGTEYTKVNARDNRTFDTTSVLSHYPREAEGSVVCKDAHRQVEEVSITYYTFVSPTKPSLFFDGESVKESVILYFGHKYNVTCVAYAARPPVKLSLVVDNVTLSLSDVKTSVISRGQSPGNESYDSWVEGEYKPTQGNHSFICMTSGEEPHQKRQTLVTVYVVDNAKSSDVPSDEQLRVLPIVLLAVIVIVLLFLSIISCWLWRRKARSTAAQNFGVTVTMLDKQSVFSRKASIIASPKTPKDEGSVQESAFTYEFGMPEDSQLQTDTKQQHQHPPRLELPDVPYVERSSNYENPCITEGVYYSDLKDDVAVGKLFHRQEMCLILSLKAGKVYNRWMGSIAATNGMTKCVFVSTVTEHILRTRELQWDVYVKRILELPESNGVTKTEGICIDGAQLYLVQEHFTCVTLDSHIQANRRVADDGTSYTTFGSCDVRKWLVDMLKGMEVIHSYGLLHPGLSTKKILVTNDNVLKVYDFCLSDDAQRKVLRLKEKMNCTLNQLAPESLLRNEYTVSSDMWSIAVVIWELLTATGPFAVDFQVTPGRNGSLFHGNWPSKYADLRNNYVFDCWRQDCSIRPTMRQLRFSFDEDNDPSERNVLTIGSETGDLDQYMPMKGFVQVQAYEETTKVQTKQEMKCKNEEIPIKKNVKTVSSDENKKSNSV